MRCGRFGKRVLRKCGPSIDPHLCQSGSRSVRPNALQIPSSLLRNLTRAGCAQTRWAMHAACLTSAGDWQNVMTPQIPTLDEVCLEAIRYFVYQMGASKIRDSDTNLYYKDTHTKHRQFVETGRKLTKQNISLRSPLGASPQQGHHGSEGQDAETSDTSASGCSLLLST